MSIASICCTRTVLICTACPSANATSTGCAASRTHRSSNRSRQEPNRARNCGEFMYWKDGKCNDARNKSSSWRAF